MTVTRPIRHGLLGLLCLMHFSCFAGDLNVLLVLSDSATPYQTFATGLRQNLPANIRVSTQENVESFSDSDQQIDLIVTVGVKAGDWVVAHTNKPVLATMLPSNKYADLIATRRPSRGFSAIFVDQPLERQVSFLRAALSDRNKIGVLHSPESDFDTGKLRTLLMAHGAALNTQSTDASDKLFNDLEDILSRSNVLLAVPDNAIYNANNIRNIMLSSYRHKVPLVGLSPAYVNAGALCAIFSTPDQLAVQAGAMVVSFARAGQLPEPQYPVAFTIAVNFQVARSLGIEMSSPEEIRNQMDQAKERER